MLTSPVPEVPPATDKHSLRAAARAWLFALFAMLAVLGTEQVIEHFARESELERERGDVLNRLAALRARLEGVVNANLFLLHGLTAVIESAPDIDQAGFEAIAAGLVDERHALRNIGVAPDMVISMVYPLQGNEAVLGLDYRSHPTQGEGALRARDSGNTVIAGPLVLQQGGLAFIAREPVFLPPEQAGGQRRFWGLVSAVIDAETLYRKAGLRDPEVALQLALRGTDGSGPQGPVFFGDAQLFSAQSVTAEIALPGGAWQIAAIPAGGWGQESKNIALIRLMGLVAALLAGIMVYRLTRSAEALASSHARQEALLKTIPDLVWLKNSRGVYLNCNPRFEDLFGARETEIRGKTDHDFMPAELADFFREKDLAAIAAGGPRTNEEWVTFASDGHRELLETTKTPVYDGKGDLLGVLGIARNITERVQAEERIHRLNRLYAVLSDINEAIVRLREPQRLFDEACRIAVEVGGLRMAWIGMAAPESREMRPLAHAGVAGDYLENLHVSPGDDARGQGPTGTALRAGQHVVSVDIASDPRMAPWREAALALGYRSSAAFPILVNGQVSGSFNLYSETRGFFDDEELRLLDKLALDIGFALDFIEVNQVRAAGEARLRLFIEHAPGALAMFDREMHYLTVTRRWLQDYHLEGRELIGCSHYEIFPEITQEWKDIHRRGLAGEVVHADEDRFERGDGTVQWLRWEVRPWYEADGAIGGIVIFSEDITARKQAEARIRQGELVLDTVFRALPDLFFLMDPDGTIRDYRANQKDALYVPPEQFLGRRMADVLPAGVSDLFQRTLNKVKEDGDLATVEYALNMPVGERYFEARIAHLPDSAQKIAVVRDISSEHQDRVKLAASETRYRQLFEQSPLPMLVYEKGSRRLLAVNEAFCNAYGYSREEALALHVPDLYPEAEKQPLIEMMEKLSGLAYVGEWHHLKKDGSLISIEVHSHDIVHEGLAARIAAISDITARKRMEEEVRQLNIDLEQRVRQRTAELAAINKELEAFTYSVSHDLKAPLRGIDGYSRLLLEQYQDQLDDEARLFLRNVRQGVEQMGQLIEDLLAYSRLERRGLGSQSVDLGRLAAGVLKERQADIEARGMAIETDMPPGLTAQADPDGLAMVLRNLIDNAIKFTRDSPAPALTIRATASGKSVMLDVCDNGIGFDMQFHDRIFEIFQRLQRAEDYPGTGIGLAIVTKAMQRMGGRVWAESRPGLGATFHLELQR